MKTTEDKVIPVAPRISAALALWLVYSGDEIVDPPKLFRPAHGATPIGREVPRGIALPRDPRASRHHATLHTGVAGTLLVVDERSRNGTLVNAQRVAEAYLADGDLLTIGDSSFVVRTMPPVLSDGDIPSLRGVSPAMASLRAALCRVGPTNATVLLLGESGTGKELAASALHALGRPEGPFVPVNCGAIPETLAESYLFGHLAGAFTGAVARPGLIRSAHGGTLFLDEVGELPLAIQPKLLRVLQDRMVVPVGATSSVPCDVRIVAATNRDLQSEVAEGRFRGDLYARLAEHPLEIMPLRRRKEDVLMLLCVAMGAPRPRLSPSLVDALLLHDYPFNVRDILALASQLRIQGAGAQVLEMHHAQAWFRTRERAPAARFTPPGGFAKPAATGFSTLPPSSAAPADKVQEGPPDRERLLELLKEHRGVVAEIARVMGRSRKQVYRWLEQAGIDVDAFRA